RAAAGAQPRHLAQRRLCQPRPLAVADGVLGPDPDRDHARLHLVRRGAARRDRPEAEDRSMSTLVAIDKLSVDFATGGGTLHALRDVTLDIPAGRIVGIVGESGSGKSTLALALLRLMPGNLARLAGKIRFAGHDLVSLPEAEMRKLRGTRIAMIF